jgi:hypothetical protein
MARPVRKVSPIEREKFRLRKTCSGSIGSAALVSTSPGAGPSGKAAILVGFVGSCPWFFRLFLM